MVLGDFDRDEGAEHNEVRREWEELQEGEVQENTLDEAARAEFSEEEEEGWVESEEFAGEDPPDDPEELPPVFSQEKTIRPQWRGDSAAELPRRPLGWNGKRKQRGLVKPDEVRQAFSPHERLLILDTWQRSGLAAGDFAPLVPVHRVYAPNPANRQVYAEMSAQLVNAFAKTRPIFRALNAPGTGE